jgi:NAD(P)-dependent dehydrogenase (short-subunit alcohol dehydrogenase family)
MVLQGGGSIVNTASIAGIRGFPGASAYVASKHGVVGLTRSAAVEYAHHKIRVNAVCPGFIETPMAARVGESGRVKPAAMAELAPIRRMGEAREIGDAASWLLSDEASFTTGVTLEVDGGYAAR